jgi:hypothetical protein
MPEADPKFRWTQWRPFGLPYGKRSFESEEEAQAYEEYVKAYAAAFPDEEQASRPLP